MSAPEPVTILDDQESWDLLASAPMGRLATVLAGQPEITPINVVVDGPTLVFRTAEGSKLFALTVNARVAFEADSWDASGGWSVVVKGGAAEVEGGADIERLEGLGLRPWVPTVKQRWVRITVDEITGRRFTFGPEPEPDYT